MVTLVQRREQEIQVAAQRKAQSGRRDFGPYPLLSLATGLFVLGAAARVIGAVAARFIGSVASSVVTAAVIAPATLRTMRKAGRSLDLAATPKGPSM